MIELAIPGLRRARQEATMRRWFELLPDQLFEVRPVLSVGYVGTLMAHGEVADVEVLLQGAERWLEPTSGKGEGTSRSRPGRWSWRTKLSSGGCRVRSPCIEPPRRNSRATPSASKPSP